MTVIDAILGIATLLGLIAATHWIVGDRQYRQRRCPKCWFDMSGVAPALRCPECGCVTRSEGDLLRSRRRVAQAIVALLISLLCAGGLVVHRVPATDTLRRLPTSVLLATTGAFDHAWPRLGRESRRIVASRRLSIRQFERFVDSSLSRLNVTSDDAERVELLLAISSLMVDEDGFVAPNPNALDVLDFWRPWNHDVWHDEIGAATNDEDFRPAVAQSQKAGFQVAGFVQANLEGFGCTEVAFAARVLMMTNRYADSNVRTWIELMERCRMSDARLEIYRLLVAMGPVAEPELLRCFNDVTADRELRYDCSNLLQLIQQESDGE